MLKALADECLKATFFEIGEHATWHPEITKQVIDAGMTVGTPHLVAQGSGAEPLRQGSSNWPSRKSRWASAPCTWPPTRQIAPFFRFPDLQHPPQLLAYLGERNIAIFSTDIDSLDFKMHKPEEVIKSVMSQLEKHGKGIILMHDFQRTPPKRCRNLSASSRRAATRSCTWCRSAGDHASEVRRDALQQDKLSSNNTRPENSVVRTIGEYKGSAPAGGGA